MNDQNRLHLWLHLIIVIKKSDLKKYTVLEINMITIKNRSLHYATFEPKDIRRFQKKGALFK